MDNSEYITSIKANNPCTDCGKYFDPVCMDFDHDPNLPKVANISSMRFSNRNVLDEEIAKCELVCANCHRLREHGIHKETRQKLRADTERKKIGRGKAIIIARRRSERLRLRDSLAVSLLEQIDKKSSH